MIGKGFCVNDLMCETLNDLLEAVKEAIKLEQPCTPSPFAHLYATQKLELLGYEYMG